MNPRNSWCPKESHNPCNHSNDLVNIFSAITISRNNYPQSLRHWEEAHEWLYVSLCTIAEN